MSSCKGCGNPIPSGAKSCLVCGMEIPKAQMFSIGEIFDEKYEILSFLGAGGMGEIYKVKHIHLEDVRVIKIMRQAFAQEEQDLKRFLQEAKIATKLHHPNVAILYDFSQYKTGLFYMVWEYIPGFDISILLKKCGRMPPGIAIYFMSQALDGLGFIHKNGIVHRDISPENLMIYRDQFGEYKLKIIDLGIAKTTALAGEHLTQTGMFLGKLKYCSPEQVGALEEGEKIDGRTDIYSIGLVLYEMLSGKSAIYSTTPYGYIHKHITQTPDPLQIPEIGGENSKKLNDTIYKALEKNRKNRYQSADSFKEELLFLPIKEPEPDELENYLKPIFSQEEKIFEKKVEEEKNAERPTILTPSRPSPKITEKEKIVEKETILSKEKPIERKETIYTPPRPQIKAVEKEMGRERPTIIPPKKRKKTSPILFSVIGLILILAIGFGILKMKGIKKPEVLKETKIEEKKEIPEKITETPKIENKEVQKPIIIKTGILKIHVLPYGRIKNLMDENGNKISLKDDLTPLFISLPEGDYRAEVLVEPSNEIVKLNFKIEAGKISEIIKPASPLIYENVLKDLF